MEEKLVKAGYRPIENINKKRCPWWLDFRTEVCKFYKGDVRIWFKASSETAGVMKFIVVEDDLIVDRFVKVISAIEIRDISQLEILAGELEDMDDLDENYNDSVA